MGKKNKKSSTSGEDLAKAKKHKKSSTTDVETVHVPSSKSLKNGKKSVMVPCSTSKRNLKLMISDDNDEDEKIDLKNETKKLSKCVKELTQVVKKLQENLETNAKVSLEEKNVESSTFCGLDPDEAEGNDDDTLLVRGIEFLGSREEIKKALSNIFGKCGEITRMFVPMECETRVSPGYAFINLKNGQGNDEALRLNGCFFKGRKLEVMMASNTVEFYGYPRLRGCEGCLKKRLDRLYHSGSKQQFDPRSSQFF